MILLLLSDSFLGRITVLSTDSPVQLVLVVRISPFHRIFQWNIFKGSGYRYACGSWNLQTYSYATCDVTVTHDESAVGLVEMK